MANSTAEISRPNAGATLTVGYSLVPEAQGPTTGLLPCRQLKGSRVFRAKRSGVTREYLNIVVRFAHGFRPRSWVFIRLVVRHPRNIGFWKALALDFSWAPGRDIPLHLFSTLRVMAHRTGPLYLPVLVPGTTWDGLLVHVGMKRFCFRHDVRRRKAGRSRKQIV
jgi:hypothetical protein